MSACASSATTSGVAAFEKSSPSIDWTSLRMALPAADGVSILQMRPLFFESQPWIQSVTQSAPSGPKRRPTARMPLRNCCSGPIVKPAPCSLSVKA